MFRRGDDDGVDARVLEQFLVIVVSLGGVAAHGLDAILGAR